MEYLTRPWSKIVEVYNDVSVPSISVLGVLAKRINDSRLAKGIHAWTSAWDLCIVQTQVTFPNDGPYLRISPLGKETLEFRYLDTPIRDKQWHRTVPAEAAWNRLIFFLDQLHWFSNLEEFYDDFEMVDDN